MLWRNSTVVGISKSMQSFKANINYLTIIFFLVQCIFMGIIIIIVSATTCSSQVLIAARY